MHWMKAAGAAVLAAGLMSCSGGKYSDAKSAMSEQASAMEDFTAGMEKAGSGKEVAAALDRYADRMGAMIEQGQKIKAKYEGVNLETAPELQAERDRIQQAASKFGQVFMKIGMQYGNDPDVRAALQKWQAISAKATAP